MLLSELISDRFLGTVHARQEDTVEVKKYSGIRFWGHCPTVIGLVARQFLGWLPGQQQDGQKWIGKSRSLPCGTVCKSSCSTERPETRGIDVPQHQAIVSTGHQASGAMARDAIASSIKLTSTSCSVTREGRHDALNDTGK